MKNKEYNWWTDPKNKEEIEKRSWWNWPENKETFPLPISVNNHDGIWVATFNNETEKILGEEIHGVAQGETKEEAIERMFQLVRIAVHYTNDRMRSYQRWVPLRVGPWKSFGGRWISVFGIHIMFRYSKNAKGGWFIPLKKLNISIHNEWKSYRRYKKNHELKF